MTANCLLQASSTRYVINMYYSESFWRPVLNITRKLKRLNQCFRTQHGEINIITKEHYNHWYITYILQGRHHAVQWVTVGEDVTE